MERIIENIKYALTNFSAADAVDIIFFALVFYVFVSALKYNNSTRFLRYFLPLLVVIIILRSAHIGLKYTSYVLSYSVFLMCIAGIVMFWQELKRWVWKISNDTTHSSAFNIDYGCTEEQLNQAMNEIVKAVLNMAKKEVGALILIENNIAEQIVESGTRIDSLVSSALLESIFITKGPLHDGAVVIRGNRIVSAGCFLPLTQNSHISKELGTRHRAAIGATENSTIFSIIVSEETGVISVARNGELQRYYDGLMLLDELMHVYGVKASRESNGKRWL